VAALVERFQRDDPIAERWMHPLIRLSVDGAHCAGRSDVHHPLDAFGQAPGVVGENAAVAMERFRGQLDLDQLDAGGAFRDSIAACSCFVAGCRSRRQL